MPRHLWLRIAVVVAVIVAAAWYLYPPRKTINLGLDLQGGIHLVLGVEVDKALAGAVERTAADLRAALDKKGIGAQVTAPVPPPVTPPGAYTILVTLTSPEAAKDAQPVFNEFTGLAVRTLDAAAGRFELTLTERRIAELRDSYVRTALETIRNRIDQFGVAEPDDPAPGGEPHPGPAPRHPGSGPGQGPDREDRGARVQAARRAGRPREGRQGRATPR